MRADVIPWRPILAPRRLRPWALGGEAAAGAIGRRTLTLENGSEFVRFKSIEAAAGIRVFYAARQRGANENTKGSYASIFQRLRLPQRLTPVFCKSVAMLYHRPRECLNYRTHHKSDTAPRGAL